MYPIFAVNEASTIGPTQASMLSDSVFRGLRIQTAVFYGGIGFSVLLCAVALFLLVFTCRSSSADYTPINAPDLYSDTA